jgi:hypothetical protein
MHLSRTEKHVMFLSGRHEGKRPVERARGRWEDNIKTVVKEIV